MNIKTINTWSKYPFNDLVGTMFAISNSKLLKDTQTTNHTTSNPTRISSLPIKLNPHLFRTIT